MFERICLDCCACFKVLIYVRHSLLHVFNCRDGTFSLYVTQCMSLPRKGTRLMRGFPLFSLQNNHPPTNQPHSKTNNAVVWLLFAILRRLETHPLFAATSKLGAWHRRHSAFQTLVQSGLALGVTAGVGSESGGADLSKLKDFAPGPTCGSELDHGPPVLVMGSVYQGHPFWGAG